MRKTISAALAAAALGFAAGPALAACYDELKADTEKMISAVEEKGDKTAAAEGKRTLDEAQRLYDGGKQRDAMIRIVRYMEKVNERGNQ